MSARRAWGKTAKAGKKAQPLGPALRWSLGAGTALYLGWLLVFPGLSGSFGLWLADRLFAAFGASAYLLPALLVRALLWHRRAGKASGWSVGSPGTELEFAL